MIYTAAHGGFESLGIPLGGGAAVCDHLVAEWRERKPFDLQLVTPTVDPADIVRFSERQYGDFSREFERQATEEVLRHDPAGTVVLANDIVEGPDFRRLAAAGYRIWTVWHIDVVAYAAALHLKGAVSPRWLVRLAEAGRPLLPSLAKLLFRKQRAAVECSAGHVVPSARMRRVIGECYPRSPIERVHVLPWGTWARDADPLELAAETARVREEYALESRPVVLTLSRISPEKGQERLLRALDEDVTIVICGGAAYMQGAAHLARLKEIASKMKRARVIFPGHVMGLRKQAWFSIADLYVFPSVYESYGLTLMEALRAGVPAVATDHAGASEILRPEFGVVTKPRRMRREILELLGDLPRRVAMSTAAREFARTQRFSDRASVLASLLGASGKD